MTMWHNHEHRWFYDGVLRVMITWPVMAVPPPTRVC